MSKHAVGIVSHVYHLKIKICIVCNSICTLVCIHKLTERLAEADRVHLPSVLLGGVHPRLGHGGALPVYNVLIRTGLSCSSVVV